jgi:hypothetical protein
MRGMFLQGGGCRLGVCLGPWMYDLGGRRGLVAVNLRLG